MEWEATVISSPAEEIEGCFFICVWPGDVDGQNMILRLIRNSSELQALKWLHRFRSLLYILSERLIIAEWMLHSLEAGLETD